jgi:hypothetical protein
MHLCKALADISSVSGGHLTQKEFLLSKGQGVLKSEMPELVRILLSWETNFKN